MKLRYYLRGLGIGILVTTIIFCIMPREKVAISDEEIRNKALEMGLVEESSLSLADVQEKLNQIAKNMEEQSQFQESMAKAEAEAESQVLPSTDQVTQENESTETLRNEALEGIDLVEYKTVIIPSGITSWEACVLLEEAGIIEDADEFDDYLNMNGLSRSVRAGSYEFMIGASPEEIRDKLLGK